MKFVVEIRQIKIVHGKSEKTVRLNTPVTVGNARDLSELRWLLVRTGAPVRGEIAKAVNAVEKAASKLDPEKGIWAFRGVRV